MGDGQRLKRRRARLFKENPYCIYCGVEMILPEDANVKKRDAPPDNLCTSEHFFSALHPRKINKKGIRGKVIICCHKCNIERGNYWAQQLGLKELHKRANRH